MPNKGLPSFLLLLLFSLIACTKAASQNAEDDSKVDSVFESLSITGQISQLLLIDTRNSETKFSDLPLSFGGILLNEPSPYFHLNKLQKLKKYGIKDVIVAAEFGQTVGVDLDSTKSFGSKAIFQNVREPYLFYETGSAIAKQANLLGIHSLLDLKSVLSFDEKPDRNFWKTSEFFQGLKDGGVLSPITFQVIDFNNFSIEDLLLNSDPKMILIKPEDVPDFHQMIQEAISADSLQLNQLEGLIKSILSIKSSVSQNDVDADINIQQLERLNFEYLDFELGKASMRLLNNSDQLIPVKSLADKKIASVNFNSPDQVFNEYLDKYVKVDHFGIDYGSSREVFAELWNELINYDLIICALHKPDMANITERESFRIFLKWLTSSSKCITVSFLQKDLLLSMPNINLISAPEDLEIFHKLAPQVIFGAIELESKIENKANDEILSLGRAFAYSYPEAVGLNSEVLRQIDSLARFAITAKAIPGCQILVARNNQIVFQKSFGYHTYDSVRAVRDDDLYDLASITKVSGALPGLMKLYEEGKFDLDATLGTYLKYFRRGNKKDLTFREILAHQAGLKAWIPYWQTTIRKNGKYRRKTLSNTQSDKYPYEVSEGIFLHKSYKKKIYKQIRKTKVGVKKYLYSGLTFYIFPDIIQEITGQKYEDYIYSNFYEPLSATTLTYRPIEKFNVDRIVPTEYDSLFRKSQIHGKVHDEGAAMMEGVSSNAGLFANANDLAKLFQMYCDYGEFGGHRYLKEETVKEFARCQYPENDNRRALGFDRPLPEPKKDGNTAISVSQSSFGHSGFTGTFAWADPKYNLVYIFLSNRVYPTRANTKLYDLNIRTNIQEVIYQAME